MQSATQRGQLASHVATMCAASGGRDLCVLMQAAHVRQRVDVFTDWSITATYDSLCHQQTSIVEG